MSTNKNCFAIFPFEHIYQMQFKHVYKPALEAAGLDVKVAGSPGVDKITVDIEKQIRNSLICFADISEKNENVWYEVGYARACNKLVVMVCDEDKRGFHKLPFDIQDMQIIGYSGKTIIGGGIKKSGEKLRGEITEDTKIKIENSQNDIGYGNLTTRDIEVLSMILNYYLQHKKGIKHSELISEVSSIRVEFSISKLIEEKYIEKRRTDNHPIRIRSRSGIVRDFNKGYVIDYIPTYKAEEFEQQHPDLF